MLRIIAGLDDAVSNSPRPALQRFFFAGLDALPVEEWLPFFVEEAVARPPARPEEAWERAPLALCPPLNLEVDGAAWRRDLRAPRLKAGEETTSERPGGSALPFR